MFVFVVVVLFNLYHYHCIIFIDVGVLLWSIDHDYIVAGDIIVGVIVTIAIVLLVVFQALIGPINEYFIP